jgi:hypothetical protein
MQEYDRGNWERRRTAYYWFQVSRDKGQCERQSTHIYNLIHSNGINKNSDPFGSQRHIASAV